MKGRLFVFSLVLLYLLPSCLLAQNATDIMLPRIFSSNMVLQQGMKVAIWGTAAPNKTLLIKIAGITAAAKADASGQWKTYLPPMKCGGPYTLEIQGKEKKTFENVMFGEVWLLSGQSNMGFTMEENEKENSPNFHEYFPQIREFAVPQEVQRVPTKELTAGAWKMCTPDNIKQYGAISFYFGRKLHLDKKVAVGIIRSTWGGTHIESWISARALSRHPHFQNEIKRITEGTDNWTALQKAGNLVNKQRDSIIKASEQGIQDRAQRISFHDSSLRITPYPITPSKMGAPPYCLFWVKKEIDIPASFKKQDVRLRLGKISMEDITYFNGVEIGRGKDDHDERVYTVPENLIREGKNVVSCRILSLWGGGHLGTALSHPSLYSDDRLLDISLKGEWAYHCQLEPDLPVGQEFQNNPTALYNSMIHPVVPYTIRGAIWYQGESDVNQAFRYRTLLLMLLSDWRSRWKQGAFPFIAVQLPGFGLPDREPAEQAAWAVMRESQSEILKYPNTALVVTTDVGDAEDLHPQNKEIIAQRAYLAATRTAYHDPVSHTGPRYSHFKKEGSRLRVYFKTDTPLSVTNGKELAGFSIAGADGKFYWAKAQIEQSNQVVVYSDKVAEPAAVRYAWANNPPGNLTDASSLPAAPFRTDHWKVCTE